MKKLHARPDAPLKSGAPSPFVEHSPPRRTLAPLGFCTAPIEAKGFTIFSNPLPHVLMLTAIVVMVSTTGVALAIVKQIYRRYRTLDEDEILERVDAIQERNFELLQRGGEALMDLSKGDGFNFHVEAAGARRAEAAGQHRSDVNVHVEVGIEAELLGRNFGGDKEVLKHLVSEYSEKKFDENF